MMALYLAPRIKRKKIHMKAEQLLQELPDISQLKPFPERMSFEIQTKKDLLISTSLSHQDLYIAVADTDNIVSIYHMLTGLKLIQLDLGDNTVIKVQFMNNDMLMIVTENSILFYSPRFSRKNFEINKKMANEIINNHNLNNKSKNLSIYPTE